MKKFPSAFLEKGRMYFSNQGFWKKIRYYSKKAGVQVVYAALLLYYLMESRSVPVRAKAGIMAALGYFILPTDLIPDVIVSFGFTDDIAVLMYALAQVSDHITPEVREKAQTKLSKWFDHVDPRQIALLEEKIGRAETGTDSIDELQ